MLLLNCTAFLFPLLSFKKMVVLIDEGGGWGVGAALGSAPDVDLTYGHKFS